jgi:hypothetical protein
VGEVDDVEQPEDDRQPQRQDGVERAVDEAEQEPFVAWMLLNYAGLGYWWALILAPIIVGLFGVILERRG